MCDVLNSNNGKCMKWIFRGDRLHSLRWIYDRSLGSWVCNWGGYYRLMGETSESNRSWMRRMWVAVKDDFDLAPTTPQSSNTKRFNCSSLDLDSAARGRLFVCLCVCVLWCCLLLVYIEQVRRAWTSFKIQMNDWIIHQFAQTTGSDDKIALFESENYETKLIGCALCAATLHYAGTRWIEVIRLMTSIRSYHHDEDKTVSESNRIEWGGNGRDEDETAFIQ